MKRYAQVPGGRKITGDDFLAMQDVYIALTEGFFSQFGNFIINGCELSGSVISAGVVMINGKACLFDGASGVSGAFYVRQAQKQENVDYKTIGQGLGYNIYFAEPCASTDAGAFRLDNALRFSSNFATPQQGNKADTAVQSATIDGTAVPKSGTELQLPGYPTLSSLAGVATTDPRLSDARVGNYLQMRAVGADIHTWLNDATPGLYFTYANNISNLPEVGSGNWWYVIGLKSINTGYDTLIAVGLNDSGTLENKQSMFIKRSQGGSWKSWRRLLFADEPRVVASGMVNATGVLSNNIGLVCTVTKSNLGIFTITHNLGTSAYNPIVCLASSVGWGATCRIDSISTNSFMINIYNTTGYIDGSFIFYIHE